MASGKAKGYDDLILSIDVDRYMKKVIFKLKDSVSPAIIIIVYIVLN